MSTATTTPIPADFPRLVPRNEKEARIVSICPLERRAEMPLGGHIHTFVIPAMERDKYHILTVSDTFQWIPGGWDDLSAANPVPERIQAPVYADVLAASLAADWSRSISPIGGLGVRVMPPKMREGTPEFFALLESLSGEVQLLAQWAISDAQDKYSNGKSRFISEHFHRRLAHWLYGETQARALRWYNGSTVEAFKLCVACGESIAPTARVCKSCGTDLVKFYRENSDLDPSGDPVVYAALTKVQAPRQTDRTESWTTAPLPVRVNVQPANLPSEVRLACVAVMEAEHRAELTAKRGQAEKDAFLVSLIPDLCMKNPELQATLMEKGYVVPDAG